MLVNDGYVKKHQGKGSIVQELPKGLGILSIEGRLANSGNNTTDLTTKLLMVRVSWPARKDDLTPTQDEIKLNVIILKNIERWKM